MNELDAKFVGVEEDLIDLHQGDAPGTAVA
jgi:hypothetical protein